MKQNDATSADEGDLTSSTVTPDVPPVSEREYNLPSSPGDPDYRPPRFGDPMERWEEDHRYERAVMQGMPASHPVGSSPKTTD